MSKTPTISDDAGDAIDVVKARVVELGEQAKETGSDALERVQELVEANPLQSIAIAFGAGYLLKMVTGPLVTAGLLGAAAYMVSRRDTSPRAKSRSSRSAK